jgi:hypothetical protein
MRAGPGKQFYSAVACRKITWLKSSPGPRRASSLATSLWSSQMNQSPFGRAYSQSRHSREESWRWPQRRPAMSEGERGARYRSATCWSRVTNPAPYSGPKERALPELFRAAALPSALPARALGAQRCSAQKESPARAVKSRGAKRLPVEPGRQDKASVEAKNRAPRPLFRIARVYSGGSW